MEKSLRLVLVCLLFMSLVYILASGNHDSGAVETYIPDTETAFDWHNYHPKESESMSNPEPLAGR